MSSSHLDDHIDLPFPDRRAIARTRMANTETRLSVSGLERVCRVRDLSPIGIGLESRDPPRPGQRVWIEMNDMDRSPAVVIWRDPGRCGLRFEMEQEIPFAARNGQAPQRPRSTRFLLDSLGQIESRDGVVSAEVIDISTGGLKLGNQACFRPGNEASIRIDGLPCAMPGRILWQNGVTAGFRFERPIAGDDLYHFLCSRAA